MDFCPQRKGLYLLQTWKQEKLVGKGMNRANEKEQTQVSAGHILLNLRGSSQLTGKTGTFVYLGKKIFRENPV